VLGGSRPWQAPECFRGAFFRLEEAKRTDMYSFGMLLWRVCLDGDPFKSLGDFDGETPKERRQKRNDAISKLKDEDHLVQHVCNSLALSGKFSRLQLEMLCEVISITLVTDSSRRELDITRIIRLLTPDNWFQPRHPVAPTRRPLEADAHLLDMEKCHSEFESVSPVVQRLVLSGFLDFAQDSKELLKTNDEEKRSASAYQLAICYANGFGTSFEPEECLKWLSFAAEKGSQKAREALPKMAEAFGTHITFTNPFHKTDDDASILNSSWASEFPHDPPGQQEAEEHSAMSSDSPYTIFNAAESCNYYAMDDLLKNSAKSGLSKDGVSPLHFLSSWDVKRAEALGRRLISAGADVNTIAKRGSTVGGTPLMWSVYGNHTQHSAILLKLGAEPMAITEDGDDSLSFAARLHMVEHLRLLLEDTRPSQVRGNLRRLVQAAASGESRFLRIERHGKRWKEAAMETLRLLQDWNKLFSDAADFRELVLPALLSSLKSPYGRMNTDVQVGFLEKTAIEASDMGYLLRESVLRFNPNLFHALLDYGVPVNLAFERKKTLLHLCAKIPESSLAAIAFAPRLLDLGASLDLKDEDGITPWMDAVLERKWDMADLLMKKGAQALAVNKEGFNILGLCINAVNLGSIKYVLRYCAQTAKFTKESLMVNPEKQISALQLAASLSLPRAHGMKIEVMGTFLTILGNFGVEPSQLNFRSDGLMPDATALDIAASKGNVHAVKNLVKKGATLPHVERMTGWTQATTEDYMQRKNLERCKFIIENWHKDEKHTRKLADDWTNLRTIDESHVQSSWEILIFDFKSRKNIQKNSVEGSR